jgi:hypothetical protein
VQRACDVCGGTYEAKRPSSRYCGRTCRVRASRAGGVPRVASADEQTAAPDPKPPPLSATLVTATERQLRDVGRLDTWLGQQALALAGKLSSGRDTASGLAALSREFRATMEEALRGANAPASSLAKHRDELAARRRASGA